MCVLIVSEGYKKTNMYNEGVEHLKNYEPVAKYIGAPFRMGWVKEAAVDGDTVKLVVPIRGGKGKGNLIIYGRKSDDSNSQE